MTTWRDIAQRTDISAETLSAAIEAYTEVWQTYPDLDASSIKAARSAAMEAALETALPGMTAAFALAMDAMEREGEKT